MEEKLAKLLNERSLQITTAESCTGGLIAGRITNVSGSSAYFKEGIVTYSNEAKEKFLHVSHETLEQHGAVSEQTAREMVLGAQHSAEAQAAIAVTGIAGPDGGTTQKPVGLVYIGCALKDHVIVKECHFAGDRASVRQQTAEKALEMMCNMILEDMP